jgi:hypothetical protein
MAEENDEPVFESEAAQLVLSGHLMWVARNRRSGWNFVPLTPAAIVERDVGSRSGSP